MAEDTVAPVCCTLPPPARRARIAEIEQTIGAKIVELRELDDGYALRFPPEPGMAEELGRFVAFERECCAFLDFTIRAQAGNGPIWLELSGSREAKEFLRAAIERWRASPHPREHGLD